MAWADLAAGCNDVVRTTFREAASYTAPGGVAQSCGAVVTRDAQRLEEGGAVVANYQLSVEVLASDLTPAPVVEGRFAVGAATFRVLHVDRDETGWLTCYLAEVA